MSIKKKTLAYSVAAIGVAIVIIIAAALFISPALVSTVTPTTSQSSTTSQGTPTSTSTSTTQQGALSSSSTFLVLLTDPPQVPTGTEQLNMTYSRVSIQVTAPNGTTGWVSVSVSGTVDLVSLANLTQTIASAKVPSGSLVKAIELDISGIQAKINGTVQAVTPVSNNITISIAQPAAVNKNVTGAILDLLPTLAQTQAVNASSGATTNGLVFIPSGVAVGKADVNQSQAHIGSRAKLSADDGDRLNNARSRASAGISVVSARLSVSGNRTTFSVTVKNSGNSSATLFGLLLKGEFNMSLSLPIRCNPHAPVCPKSVRSTVHPGVIPFRVNGTSLIPLFGFEGHLGEGNISSGITIGAGQSVTLTFDGIIGVQSPVQAQARGHAAGLPSIVLTPVPGQSYTIRLMGEGFSTFQVKAV